MHIWIPELKALTCAETPTNSAPFVTASPDTILAIPFDIPFDFVAVHLKGDQAADPDLRIDFSFTDHDETWTMWIQRGVHGSVLGHRVSPGLMAGLPR